jgi:hypothetical protein
MGNKTVENRGGPRKNSGRKPKVGYRETYANLSPEVIHWLQNDVHIASNMSEKINRLLEYCIQIRAHEDLKRP